MSFGGIDPRLEAASVRVAGSRAQLLALQFVGRSLDKSAFNVEHVGSTGGLAVAALRAATVLQAHGRTGQPYLQHVRRFVDHAIAVTDDCDEVLPGDAQLAAIRSALLGLPAGTGDSPASRAAAGSMAVQVASQVAEAQLRVLAERLLAVLWHSEPWDGDDWDRSQRAARHLSSIVSLRGRTLEGYVRDLERLAGAGVPAALTEVAQTLLPETATFLVACAVEGTRYLEDLDKLLPGAICFRRTYGEDGSASWAPAAKEAAWMQATERLKKYLQGVAAADL